MARSTDGTRFAKRNILEEVPADCGRESLNVWPAWSASVEARPSAFGTLAVRLDGGDEDATPGGPEFRGKSLATTSSTTNDVNIAVAAKFLIPLACFATEDRNMGNKIAARGKRGAK